RHAVLAAAIGDHRLVGPTSFHLAELRPEQFLRQLHRVDGIEDGAAILAVRVPGAPHAQLDIAVDAGEACLDAPRLFLPAQGTTRQQRCAAAFGGIHHRLGIGAGIASGLSTNTGRRAARQAMAASRCSAPSRWPTTTASTLPSKSSIV